MSWLNKGMSEKIEIKRQVISDDPGDDQMEQFPEKKSDGHRLALSSKATGSIRIFLLSYQTA